MQTPTPVSIPNLQPRSLFAELAILEKSSDPATLAVAEELRIALRTILEEMIEEIKPKE